MDQYMQDQLEQREHKKQQQMMQYRNYQQFMVVKQNIKGNINKLKTDQQRMKMQLQDMKNNLNWGVIRNRVEDEDIEDQVIDQYLNQQRQKHYFYQKRNQAKSPYYQQIQNTPFQFYDWNHNINPQQIINPHQMMIHNDRYQQQNYNEQNRNQQIDECIRYCCYCVCRCNEYQKDSQKSEQIQNEEQKTNLKSQVMSEFKSQMKSDFKKDDYQEVYLQFKYQELIDNILVGKKLFNLICNDSEFVGVLEQCFGNQDQVFNSNPSLETIKLQNEYIFRYLQNKLQFFHQLYSQSFMTQTSNTGSLPPKPDSYLKRQKTYESSQTQQTQQQQQQQQQTISQQQTTLQTNVKDENSRKKYRMMNGNSKQKLEQMKECLQSESLDKLKQIDEIDENMGKNRQKCSQYQQYQQLTHNLSKDNRCRSQSNRQSGNNTYLVVSSSNPKENQNSKADQINEMDKTDQDFFIQNVQIDKKRQKEYLMEDTEFQESMNFQDRSRNPRQSDCKTNQKKNNNNMNDNNNQNQYNELFPVYVNGQLTYQNRVSDVKKQESEDGNDYIIVDNNNVYLNYSKKNSRDIDVVQKKNNNRGVANQTEVSKDNSFNNDDEVKAQSLQNHHHQSCDEKYMGSGKDSSQFRKINDQIQNAKLSTNQNGKIIYNIEKRDSEVENADYQLSMFRIKQSSQKY